MQSSLIGKIQKAHLYAEEPNRVAVQGFTATFRGDHDEHRVTFGDGRWSCTCTFFPQWGTCSHIMATQRILGPISPFDQTPSMAAETAVS